MWSNNFLRGEFGNFDVSAVPLPNRTYKVTNFVIVGGGGGCPAFDILTSHTASDNWALALFGSGEPFVIV